MLYNIATVGVLQQDLMAEPALVMASPTSERQQTTNTAAAQKQNC